MCRQLFFVLVGDVLDQIGGRADLGVLPYLNTDVTAYKLQSKSRRAKLGCRTSKPVGTQIPLIIISMVIVGPLSLFFCLLWSCAGTTPQSGFMPLTKSKFDDCVSPPVNVQLIVDNLSDGLSVCCRARQSAVDLVMKRGQLVHHSVYHCFAVKRESYYHMKCTAR